MISVLKESDIIGLNSLPPLDWEFDYETFVKDFLITDYFYAFVIRKEERVIGTGNVFLKGKIGWLANIIIAEDQRGRGLGLKMTKFLVDFLSQKGCETQLLLATELGRPLYQKLGFKKIADYQCFDTEIEKEYNSPPFIRELDASDLKKVHELDQEANAENRTHLINRYFKNGLGYFNEKNQLLGCYLPDFGRGLILSRDQAAGIELLQLKHSKKGSRTLLPTYNQAGIHFLEKYGLKKGHQCFRMILGKENAWNPEYIYSYGSGYCG